MFASLYESAKDLWSVKRPCDPFASLYEMLAVFFRDNCNVYIFRQGIREE